MSAATPNGATRASGWVVRARARVLAFGRWHAAAAGLVAGAVSTAAMAPFFLWPVLYVTLPVLVWLIDRSTACTGRSRWMAGFWPGWWFGFGYFLLGLFWIGEAFLVEAERVLWLLPFAVTLLPAGLAIFFGAATAVAAALSRPGAERVVVLALALSGTEWLRGHIFTGFPWNTLGYALTMPLALMQSASLVGIYGLTLAVVLICALPAIGVASGRRLRSALAIALVPVAAMALFGVVRLAGMKDASVPGVRLRLVQPSVPQREKWRPENQRQIFFDHIALSQQSPAGRVDGMAAVTHVIWPEAAMPFRPLQSPEALAAISEMLPPGRILISGGLRTIEHPDGGVEARNSLMVFGGGTPQVTVYDKLHLVPFGEYLPFRPVLERIGLQELARQRGGFGIGPAPRPLLNVPGLPGVTPLICYEAIFPAAVIQTEARPGVMINLTNDGWFGNTTGPRQHFHQARVRAVEEGVPLVRVANNGISGVVAPSGRIAAWLGMNERGSLDADLPQAANATPYSRFGDVLFAALWCLVLIICLAEARRDLWKSD